VDVFRCKSRSIDTQSQDHSMLRYMEGQPDVRKREQVGAQGRKPGLPLGPVTSTPTSTAALATSLAPPLAGSPRPRRWQAVVLEHLP
jgi:hypothetical protein